MKFPKEKVRIMQLVKDYFVNQEYSKIYKMKDEMFLLYDDLKETNVFNDLIVSCFYLKIFDEAIIIGEVLNRRAYESFTTILYVLLSCLGCFNIYHALSIIRRSKLLALPEIKVFYEKGGANYFNLLKYDKANNDLCLALVIVNFIIGLSKEDEEISKEYLLIRSFELADTLFEIGYSEDTVDKLTHAIKVIFF